MAKGEIRVGDIGTVFELTIKDQDDQVVPINQATVKEITLKKPSGTKVTKTAVFSTDGTDGKMRYTSVADDLDVAGDWSYQGYVELPDGKWKTDIHSFRVHSNL